MMTTTRTGRQQRIVDLLATHEIRNQNDLLPLLEADGITVTQATLSRDLVEIGAVKVRKGGQLVYAVPGETGDGALVQGSVDQTNRRLKRACEDLLVSARASDNLVVLRTPPGAANYLASTIDQTRDDEILGTIAGDDTILLITVSKAAGPRVAKRLFAMTVGPEGEQE